MKWKFFILSFLAHALAQAQIPNPDFENWNTKSFDRLDHWLVLGAPMLANGYQSPRAVRIQRDPLAPQSPGAVLYGTPVANGIAGGVPMSCYPDSLVGYFKLGMEYGDTGFVIFNLKKKGAVIGLAYIPLIGNDSNNWVRLSTPVYYTDTGNSDTIVLGVAANNPAKNYPKSWVIVDSLHFSGGVTAEIPNGNFESWTKLNREDPKGWFSTNLQLPPGYPATISRSTDKVFGNYSVRIQSVQIPAIGLFPGYILAGATGASGPLPGFAVNQRDTMFYFNYKFEPMNQDTMSVGILYYDSGVLVGAGFYASGDVQNTWKEVGMPVGYLPLYAGTPDSAAVFCAPFQGGENPTGESVLFVDALKRNTPMNKMVTQKIAHPTLALFPNPAKESIVVSYTLMHRSDVEISLLPASGQKVKHIFYQALAAGNYTNNFDINDLGAGIYTCVLISEGHTISEKVVVVK